MFLVMYISACVRACVRACAICIPVLKSETLFTLLPQNLTQLVSLTNGFVKNKKNKFFIIFFIIDKVLYVKVHSGGKGLKILHQVIGKTFSRRFQEVPVSAK